uniref:Fatty acid desaturase domain-containing protein n=1 Tax=Vitis vinifera TaxID=29760 RepID=F6HVT6_VITVI
MSSPGFNKLTQILVENCITGISIAWWKWTHNAHHIACNSLDYESDLQHIPMFTVSSNLFNSIKSIFCGRILKFNYVARFLEEYSRQSFEYFGDLCVLDMVPSSCFMFAQLGREGDLMYMLGRLVGTISLRSRLVGQLIFHAQLGWTGFMVLEHHLFPQLPRCHLRSISSLVKDLCKKHNLPYRGLSLQEANVSTIRTLRTAALQARDLTNLVPKNLVWEAANIHG